MKQSSKLTSKLQFSLINRMNIAFLGIYSPRRKVMQSTKFHPRPISVRIASQLLINLFSVSRSGSFAWIFCSHKSTQVNSLNELWNAKSQQILSVMGIFRWLNENFETFWANQSVFTPQMIEFTRICLVLTDKHKNWLKRQAKLWQNSRFAISFNKPGAVHRVIVSVMTSSASSK